MKMKTAREEIKEFIPSIRPKMVILGTMAAVNARVIEGEPRPKDAFYYHNNLNRFWEILQLVFEPLQPARKLTSIDDKKQFLNKNGVALANIVRQITVDEKVVKIPDDKYVFDAFSSGRGEFKKVSPKFKAILKSTPLFFTCSSDKKILNLVDGYFAANKLNLRAEEKVGFLMTPTRCNATERSLGWKIRMAQAGVKTKAVSVPGDYL